MPSQPIPGSSGEILHELPSPYLPHPATGLLHLPRFLAKCRIVRRDGQHGIPVADLFDRPLEYPTDGESLAEYGSCGLGACGVIDHHRNGMLRVDGMLGYREMGRFDFQSAERRLRFRNLLIHLPIRGGLRVKSSG